MSKKTKDEIHNKIALQQLKLNQILFLLFECKSIKDGGGFQEQIMKCFISKEFH